MNGRIDESGRALLTIVVRSIASDSPSEVDAWIDTGFTGDLVLPIAMINSLRLQKSGSVDAILADGSERELPTFTCLLEWFGSERQLEVVANAGEQPLLGVGLLLGLEFRANYRTLSLTLNAG